MALDTISIYICFDRASRPLTTSRIEWARRFLKTSTAVALATLLQRRSAISTQPAGPVIRRHLAQRCRRRRRRHSSSPPPSLLGCSLAPQACSAAHHLLHAPAHLLMADHQPLAVQFLAPQQLYSSPAGEAALHRLYAATLAALPFAHEERWVQTASFGRVHVVVCGPPAGLPLLLLAGATAPTPFMLCAPSLRPLIERFRVYCPDLPCHGESGLDGLCQAVRRRQRSTIPAMPAAVCACKALLLLESGPASHGCRHG